MTVSAPTPFLIFVVQHLLVLKEVRVCDGDVSATRDTYILAGNLPQLLHRDGWAFHDSLAQYGGVVKLRGAYGVCAAVGFKYCGHVWMLPGIS